MEGYPFVIIMEGVSPNQIEVLTYKLWVSFLLEYCVMSSIIKISTEYRTMLNGWGPLLMDHLHFEGAKLCKRNVAVFTYEKQL